jgi:hypothetical protein
MPSAGARPIILAGVVVAIQLSPGSHERTKRYLGCCPLVFEQGRMGGWDVGRSVDGGIGGLVAVRWPVALSIDRRDESSE